MTKGQLELTERLQGLPDVEERLMALVAQGRRAPGLAEGERTEERLVRGCSARLWVAGEAGEDGTWFFRVSSEAPMVQGLAWFLCRCVNGLTAGEIQETGTAEELLAQAGVWSGISGSRRRGTEEVMRRLKTVSTSDIQ